MNIKKIALVIVVLLILLVIFANVIWNSDKLSTHRVSLICNWSDSSPNARDRIDWPDDLARYVQMRNDWINGGIFGYYLSPVKEGGVTKFSITEKIDKYYRVEFRSDYKETTEYNRETLSTRMTLDFNDGDSVWVGGPCRVITPSVFEAERERNIKLLKSKQKI
ncbi:hypothetical protein N9Q42_00765 [bacterium]|nr:hypothetical protein [bacterium]